MDRWDAKFKAEYLEQQAKRYNISHYVKGERQHAAQQAAQQATQQAEQRAAFKFQQALHQSASILIDLGLKDEDVLKATLLTPEQLKEIKENKSK